MTKKEMQHVIEELSVENKNLKDKLHITKCFLYNNDEIIDGFIDVAYNLLEASENYLISDLDTQEDFDNILNELYTRVEEFSTFAEYCSEFEGEIV